MAEQRSRPVVPLAHSDEKEHRRLLAMRANAGVPKERKFYVEYSAKTGNYTLTDNDYLIVATGTVTITLPTAVNRGGREYLIKNAGVGTVTLDGDGSETIDNLTTQTVPSLSAIKVISDNAEWWIV